MTDMPGGRMDVTSPEDVMPSGSMDAGPASSHDDMPGSRDGRRRCRRASRFGPVNLPPGARPPEAWEPGVVEVQFRDEVAAEVTSCAERRGTRDSERHDA